MQRSLMQLLGFAFALTQVATAAATQDASSHTAAPAEVTLAEEPRAEITQAELEAHVRFLASDELAGRFTGSEGADRAARYLALVLERQGIEPAGDGGSFLQDVPMSRGRPRKIPELRFTDRADASFDAVFGRDFDSSEEPLVLDSIPVIVATTEAAIPREADPRSALFVDASTSKRRQWLANAGHPGGQGFAVIIEAGSDKPGIAAEKIPVAGRPVRSPQGGAAAKTTRIRARGTFLERLRKGEVARISFASHVEREIVRGANVVGRIRGKSDEVVVLSAHYDHLDSHVPPPRAEGETEAPDTIFNGADDDASGVAAVLELAGALAAGPRPELSVVFLLATGEEVGLLGTNEYLDRPVVPLEKTVANLNFEMIGRPDELVGGAGVLWLTGHELTNLGPAWTEAGLRLKPDPRPDQQFFRRSDNYAFVVRGVVGQSFSTYNMHTDYHTPDDEVDRLDFAHMEACTKVALDAVRMVTDAKIRPAWIPGKEPTKR